jgi:hypothetical protein
MLIIEIRILRFVGWASIGIAFAAVKVIVSLLEALSYAVGPLIVPSVFANDRSDLAVIGLALCCSLAAAVVVRTIRRPV